MAYIQNDIVVSAVKRGDPRLPALIPVAAEKFGELAIFPLWPNDIPVEGVPLVLSVASSTELAPVVPAGSFK